MRMTTISDINGKTLTANMVVTVGIKQNGGALRVDNDGTPVTFVVCEGARRSLLSYNDIARLRIVVTGAASSDVLHDVKSFGNG